MTNVSEFRVNYTNLDIDTLLAQTGDLMILESGLTSDVDGTVLESWTYTAYDGATWPAGLTLSRDEVQSLTDQGRTVVGYVNVSVTDHARGYWDNDWVQWSDASNLDYGPLNPNAGDIPDWLLNNHGYAGSGDGNAPFGYIVDYTDPEWQARVIAEAVHMVTSVDQGGLGYGGVFLDDVVRYLEAAENDGMAAGGFATDMLRFVSEIMTEVRAVNPEAYIAVNSGAYIGWDNDLGAQTVEVLAYFDMIDALMMENQYGTDAWGDVLNNDLHWGGDVDFLAVQSINNPDTQTYADWAYDRGLIPYLLAAEVYDGAATLTQPGTAGDDVIFGGDGPNALKGIDGADEIRGAGGDDTLYGGKHDDLIFGGKGDDALYGQAGADDMRAGQGDDILLGGGGGDKLRGNKGDDTFLFTKLTDSAVGTTYDRIMGFEQGQDVIDVAALATGWTLALDSGLKGGGPTVGTRDKNDHTVVSLDVDGDGAADMKMLVMYVQDLTADDFVLV